MSSHHIVRDNQEPALVILSPIDASSDGIQGLLEWSPLIIVNELSLEHILRWGIKIDVVLAVDTKNEKLLDQIQHQQPVTLISVPADGELEKIIAYLAKKQFAAATIVTDQPIWSELEKLLSIDVSIIHEKIRWVLVRKGKYDKKVSDGIHYFLRTGDSMTRHESVNGRIQEERTELFWIGEAF
jgi:hypothetical protein